MSSLQYINMYPVNKSCRPDRKPPKRFIKGPIPLEWIQAAARLPGRSLHVGLVLWYLAGVRRSKQGPISYTVASYFGLNRHTVYRGLARLEEAALITVSRKHGRRLGFSLMEEATFVTERSEVMGVKQRLARTTRGVIDGQLDWLDELGESVEPIDGNAGGDTRSRRAGGRIWVKEQHSDNGDRGHDDQQGSEVDQRGS